MVVGITLSNGLGPGHSQNNGPLLAWKAYYFGNNPTPLGVTLHLAHIFVFRLRVGRGPLLQFEARFFLSWRNFLQ